MVKLNWGERSEPRIGEVNANCVCMYVCLYVINRPHTLAHAQKLARHTCLSDSNEVCFFSTSKLSCSSTRVHSVKWIYILKMDEQNSQEREERLRRR